MESRVRHRPHSAAAIAFYTQCRLWHGYLSAFAFLVLFFFSATGILLNHPDWFSGEGGQPRLTTGRLPLTLVTAARKEHDAGAALALLAEHKLAITGTYSSSDVENDSALLRFEGVKGSSDVSVNLATGVTRIKVTPADPVTVLDDLHRGKNAGPAWQFFIDASGVLILVLSLLGYILFFAMRFRLRTSLLLTAASVAAIGCLFFFLVP